jgi:hypothetical protein
MYLGEQETGPTIPSWMSVEQQRTNFWKIKQKYQKARVHSNGEIDE